MSKETTKTQELLQFIELVKKYPCIYDPTTQCYPQKYTRHKAWHKIAAEFKSTVKKCKLKWKNIRTCYARHFKAKYSSSFPELKYAKSYYLSDALKFLVPIYLKTSKHSLNLQSLSCDTDYIEDDFEIEDEQTESQDHNQDFENNTENPSDNLPSSAFDTEYQKIIDMANSELQDSPIKIFKSEIPEQDSSQSYKRPLRHIMPKKKAEVEKSKDNMDGEEHFDSETDKRHHSEPLSVDEQFLLSLKDDMSEMNSRQKRLFKKGVYDLIGQILDGTNNPCNQYVLAITPSSSISSFNNIA